MKALTVWQPWASLVALGKKRIETRSWSTSYRGRLLIHAAKREPSEIEKVGRYAMYPSDRRTGERHPNHPDGRPVRLYDDEAPGFGVASWVPLPLGAVVASAVLADVVPIIDWCGPPNPDGFVEKSPDGARLRVALPDGPNVIERSATEELPFGDYRPGRFAWLLDDVEPTSRRCPRCWGTGNSAERVFAVGPAYNADEGALPCSTCGGLGSCEPVPMRGRQGLWMPSWTASEETGL